MKQKILICGILPPPFFGHSAMYKILMESAFVDAFEVIFLDMRFWSYEKHKKVTLTKLLKLVKYFVQYIYLILRRRPGYILYNISFDKMPFLKDVFFCGAGKLLGCRIVLHDMGQYVRELHDSSGNFYQSLICWLLKNVTAIVVLGESVKSVYKGFIDDQRLFVVPGSVEDTRHLQIAGSRNGSSDINILFFSFMSESKGVFTAFKAVPKVLAEDSRIRFTFAGPVGSELVQTALSQLKQTFNLRVEHLGYIGDALERTKMYRNADIFIFPTHRDVFGLVLLHAMAEGLPIVASREGSVLEIIQDGVNGFLVEKGNADQLAQKILSLAGDPQLRQKIGSTNRERYVSVYSPQQYAANMIHAFAEIKKLGS